MSTSAKTSSEFDEAPSPYVADDEDAGASASLNEVKRISAEVIERYPEVLAHLAE